MAGAVRARSVQFDDCALTEAVLPRGRSVAAERVDARDEGLGEQGGELGHGQVVSGASAQAGGGVLVEAAVGGVVAAAGRDEMGVGVEVPLQDIREGRSLSLPLAGPESGPRDQPLVRIHSARETPSEAFVAVRYQGHWFWIDNRDFRSKGIFSFLLLLTSLAETGIASQAPVLTVPAN